MGLLFFNDIGISGMAAAIPQQVINNYEYDPYFRKQEIKEVVDKIGVKERRFADEKPALLIYVMLQLKSSFLR